jgi:hypothetical protein
MMDELVIKGKGEKKKGKQIRIDANGSTTGARNIRGTSANPEERDLRKLDTEND